MAGTALIIDGDQAFAQELSAAFSTRGFDSRITGDGKQGLDMARAEPPDAIVLCVELPQQTSGYSICAKLKKDPNLKAIPLVITSGKASEETFEHHRKLKTRAQVYLKKPFHPDSLLESLAPLVHFEVLEVGLDAIEEVAMESEPLEVLNDSDAFSIEEEAAMEEVTHESPALYPQSEPAAPLSLGLDRGVGLQDDFDEDDVRTTVGMVPGISQTVDDPLALKVKIAELEDALLAAQQAAEQAKKSEDAVRQQIELGGLTVSQVPQAGTASRELLSLKKDLNAKDRELLELKDQLQGKDRQLLNEKDRQMELETELVQAQELQAAAEQGRFQAEARIAEAEAEAARQVVEAQNDARQQVQVAEAAAQAEVTAAQAEVVTAQGETANLRQELSDKEANFTSDLESAASREAELNGVLESVSMEAEGLRETLGQRLQQIEGLEQDLATSRAEAERLDNELSASNAESESLRNQLAQSQIHANELAENLSQRDNQLADTQNQVLELQQALSLTEGQVQQAEERIREDEEARGRARQALEISLKLLSERSYFEPVEEVDGELQEPLKEDLLA